MSRPAPPEIAPSLHEGAEDAELLIGYFAYVESFPGETTFPIYRAWHWEIVLSLLVQRRRGRRRRDRGRRPED